MYKITSHPCFRRSRICRTRRSLRALRVVSRRLAPPEPPEQPHHLDEEVSRRGSRAGARGRYSDTVSSRELRCSDDNALTEPTDSTDRRPSVR